jgi:hypothetical protein
VKKNVLQEISEKLEPSLQNFILITLEFLIKEEKRGILLINIRKYSPRDKSAIFSPDFFVFLRAPCFISPLPPYEENKKIYWVEIWNHRAVKKMITIEVDQK